MIFCTAAFEHHSEFILAIHSHLRLMTYGGFLKLGTPKPWLQFQKCLISDLGYHDFNNPPYPQIKLRAVQWLKEKLWNFDFSHVET